jgi:hypothetical protein
MQIVNDTDQDARVRVAGGSGMNNPGHSAETEDPSKWQLLPSKGTMAPKPSFPVPWTVHFVVNGCRIAKEVRSERSVIRLTPDGRTFAAEVD